MVVRSKAEIPATSNSEEDKIELGDGRSRGTAGNSNDFDIIQGKSTLPIIVINDQGMGELSASD